MDYKKVVIYARVSSREQEKEGFSIPAQLKLLREYAQKNGFEIVQEYSDAETAKKAGRTNYNAMLDYLKANPDTRTILVEKTDRLYRNFKDYVTLEDYDLEVHLVKEGSIISKNSKSHDKFIHGIKVLMAKNYIDNLSEEISKGLHEGLEQGYWPFQPPYGYKRGAKKSLYIDPLRVGFVRRAFELFATGRYSLRKLSEKLFEDGYYYQSERPKITQCVLESMLKNVIYTGQMRCNGIIYQGKHPAIVGFNLFNKTQQAFKKVSKSKVRKNFHFLYPGLAKCEVCGYAMCGEVQKNNVYYRCSHHDRTCTNTSYISEKQMTSALRRHLSRIGLNDKLYELVKTSLTESLRDEQHYHKTELERLNKEIEKCTDILKKMYLDQLNKVIDMDLWITIKNEYEIKLNRLNAELQRHQNANIDYLETGMKILDVCHKTSLPYSELKPEMIAQLVWQSYSSVTVKAKSVKVKFAEPFATLEKLVRVAKQGIAELGYDEFAKTLENSKTACLKGIKKEPTGSFECVSPSSTCMKWWRIGDSNS